MLLNIKTSCKRYMKEKKIYKCSENHYYVREDICPFCGKSAVEEIEQRPGDCVECGQLCPDGVYACNNPVPLSE